MSTAENDELGIVAFTADGGIVLSNGSVLSQRELDIVRLLMTGARNREIATQLFLSVHTVEYHITHILQKLGVRNRTEAGMKAIRVGLDSVRQDVRPASSVQSRTQRYRPRRPAGFIGWRIVAPLLLVLGGMLMYLILWGTPFEFESATTNALVNPTEIPSAAPHPPDVVTD
ncbi:MAG: LuxR C-terminal-related transcriptional regulator [Dehalococcoidia bacterium]|nr:LuxR C-terminal-related transcriptional regulator [Dehalococcoidia bacterium]